MLDIRWLDDLLAVAETRNITRVAERRNISQSRLSRRIQALEYWAAKLIDRSRSPLILTEAGQILLSVAGETLRKLQEARALIHDSYGAHLTAIRFAAPHILSTTFFPQWLPTVQHHSRLTRLSIVSDGLTGCVTLFREGAVDFVVCLVDRDGAILARAGWPFSADADWISVGQESLNPLSAPKPESREPAHQIGAASTAPATHLTYIEECSLGWAVKGLIAKHPELANIRGSIETARADELRSATLAGLGAAWLPLSTTHNDILRGRLVRAGDSRFTIELDVRLYRPRRRLSQRAEELWSALSGDRPSCAVIDQGAS